MSGTEQDSRKKKVLFLAAVIAAGILIYALFGKNSVQKEELVFSDSANKADNAAVSAPLEAALASDFETVLPEAGFRLESRDKKAAVYAFSAGEIDAELKLMLESGRVEEMKIIFDLPVFPEKPSASPTPVEKGLYEKRTQAFENAVTECIFCFQTLTQSYAENWPETGQTGRAADAFRAALLEGRSERVEKDGWRYDLLSLRNSEKYAAEITVAYLGEDDEE